MLFLMLTKRYKRRKGIIIYMSCVFKTATFLKTGVYIYIYIYNDNNNNNNNNNGEFSSESQRPITCLNTVYKWFTSCPLEPFNSHLEDYDLVEGEQRGAKEKCSGTTDN